MEGPLLAPKRISAMTAAMSAFSGRPEVASTGPDFRV
jgi:hypothetical protein